MNYEEKYKIALSLLLNLCELDKSNIQLEESVDFLDNSTDKEKENSNFWDTLDIGQDYISHNLRKNIKSKLNIDIDNLNVEQALELLDINPNIAKRLNCLSLTDDERENTDLVRESLLEKQKILKLIKE